MKRLFTLLVTLLSLVFFSSCNKENDSFDASDIVGNWEIQRATLVSGGSEIDIDLSETGMSLCFRFDDDGTGATWGTDISEESFTYSLDGNVLVVEQPLETLVFTVNALSGNEMSLSTSVTEEGVSMQMTFWLLRI